MTQPISLAAALVRNLQAARRQPIVAGYVRATGDESATADLRGAGAGVVHTGALPACLSALHAGDTLMVATADQIARSPAALLALQTTLAARSVGLVILRLGDASLDTRSPASKPLLAVLAGIAAWGRQTQRAGIAAAHAAGRYRGKAATIDREAVAHLAGTVGPSAAARQLGIARSSVYRALAHEGRRVAA